VVCTALDDAKDKGEDEEVVLCKFFLLREVFGGVFGNWRAEKSIDLGSNVPPGCWIKGE